MTKKPFYITTPIYYVNALPHIGTAYTTLVSDVIARFKRLDGHDVKFLTGTDEHGQKIDKAAIAANLSPQEFTDKISDKFKELFELMNFSNDDFIRTTEQRHKIAATEFWNTLHKNGHIYLDKYSGWYAVRDESFYQESELVEGKAPTGAPVEWVEEESFFFDLSKWQDKLLEFYAANPDFVTPKTRFNEIINFVKSGLRDLSISRTTFTWGIPIPGHPKHVMYVWLDALTNYISALGYPDNTEDYKKFWPVDIHMVGKDITKFHAIYWPAFLMAAGLELPKQIVSHGWWLNRDEKISKSLGNVIDPHELVQKFGLDQVRYYLMREMSFGNDSSFTEESFTSRVNGELANKIGNMLQRTLSIVHKNGGIKCDKIDELYKSEEVLSELNPLFKSFREKFEAFHFNTALEDIVLFADKINVYIDKMAPWVLVKTDKVKTEEVLYVVLEASRQIAIMLLPFIPNSANKMLDQLGVSSDFRDFKCVSKDFALRDIAVEQPTPIFAKTL